MQRIYSLLKYYRLLLFLTVMDIQKTYKGTLFGGAWLLIQPVTMLVVYWFVFRVGWGVKTGADAALFFPWLMVGMLVWFFASEAYREGATAYTRYKHLVTKMTFPSGLIPVFVVLSKLFTHLLLAFIVLTTLGMLYYEPTIYWLQLPLLALVMAGFFIIMAFLTGPLVAISRDFGKIIKTSSRILFWLSGVLWNIDKMPIDWVKNIAYFNPFTFFIESYRSALLYSEWFWQDTRLLFGFLATTAFLIVIMMYTYRRSSTDMKDVL